MDFGIGVEYAQAAELLLEYFPKERTELMAHLDTAIPELRDMEVKPFLEKALKLKVEWPCLRFTDIVWENEF